jgi:hypothetical protein
MNNENTNCPSFNDAEAQFRNFLRSSAWPEDVVWVCLDDVAVIEQYFIVHPIAKGRIYASEKYEKGALQNLGVLLSAICRDNINSYCAVWIPSDSAEAEYALMPQGLKLSVPSEPRQGKAVTSEIRWWWLKRISVPWQMMWGDRNHVHYATRAVSLMFMAQLQTS